MAEYRITVDPVWAMYEFLGWEWSVYYSCNGIDGGTVENRLKSGTGYYRWLAMRRAEKYARNHAEGLAEKPPKTDHLDYTYNPRTKEGRAN